MGILSSIPILSLGSGVFGVTMSIMLAAIMMGLWALVLMILHPLHAVIFLLAALMEYALIYFFGFYVILFAMYTLLLRRWLPLPKSEIEHLFKLSQLHQEGLLSQEEYTAAKKRLLKL